MKIKDFMDLDKLQSIQDQFSDATGLAVIIVDTEGNYVTRGSNFTGPKKGRGSASSAIMKARVHIFAMRAW